MRLIAAAAASSASADTSISANVIVGRKKITLYVLIGENIADDLTMVLAVQAQ